MLRVDAGGLHPEQAGAKCDGSTDDSGVFNHISYVTSSLDLYMYSLRIALTPGRQCYLGNTWILPVGATVDGGYTPNQRGFQSYKTGILLAPTATLQMAYSSTIQNALVFRSNLSTPATYGAVASALAQWGSENGQLTSIVQSGGASGSGAGCKDADILVLEGGQGTPAVAEVTGVSGTGAVLATATLRSGAYINFPSPTTNVPTQATPGLNHCTSLPTFNITTGLQRSVGVLETQDDSVNNVMVVGFNAAVAVIGQSSGFRNLYFDRFNGADVSQVGDNAFYGDSHGIGYWSTSVGNQVGFGAYAVLAYPSPGSGYVAGNTYTAQPSAGSCTTTYPPPQPSQATITIVVNTVNQTGGITSANIVSVGACSEISNPVTVLNSQSATEAQLTLQLVGSGFRPGIAYSFHDQCDGCSANNLTEHGWLTGLYLSNVWTMNVDNFVVECGSAVNSYGLLVQGAASVITAHAHVGGCQYPLELDGAPVSDAGKITGYPYIPPYNAGANTSTNVVIIGGEADCSYSSSSSGCPYLVHAGPYSNGMLFGFDLGAAPNLMPCPFVSAATTSCPVAVDQYATWTVRNLLGSSPAPFYAPDATVNSDYGSVSCPMGMFNPSTVVVTNGLITQC